MSIAVWSDNYLTGNLMVDGQHKELFRIVNELHYAIVAGKGKEVLAPTLARLNDYTAKHFSAEEGLMASVQYPQLAVHRAKHQALLRRASEIVEGYRSGKTVR